MDFDSSIILDRRFNMELEIEEAEHEESFKSEEDNQASFIQRNVVDCSLRKPLIEESFQDVDDKVICSPAQRG